MEVTLGLLGTTGLRYTESYTRTDQWLIVGVVVVVAHAVAAVGVVGVGSKGWCTARYTGPRSSWSVCCGRALPRTHWNDTWFLLRLV